MSNPNDKPKHVPNYDGERRYLLAGDQPATRPIPVKARPKPSPKLSEVDLSASLHKGMENASRRIKVVQGIDILLQHNADLIDHFETQLANCKTVHGDKSASGA